MEEPSHYETVRLHIELGPRLIAPDQNPQLSVCIQNIINLGLYLNFSSNLKPIIRVQYAWV